MNDLRSWFRAEARRQGRARFLEDALLSDRIAGYAWYRLRYFGARLLAATVVHSIRFLFIYYLFSRQTFVALVLAHAGAGFVGSFWWGALEVMRARIRRHYRGGRTRAISGEVTRWLALASTFSIAALGTGVGLALWNVGEGGGMELSQFYALAILIRLALEFVTRTFHSGVYAVRRIYRPVWAIVAVELVGFAAVMTLFPLIGAWGLPIAMIVASGTIAWVTVHYTIRAYRLLAVPLPAWLALHVTRTPGAFTREFFVAGLSYALMKMDSFLVLSLFATSLYVGGPDLFVLFFVVSPAIQAGFDWAQLFYFDLKRLELRPFTVLRQRYERSVFRLTGVLGVVTWALACLTAELVYPGDLENLYWLLLPFFATRSLLAYVQIEAFAERRYGTLMQSAVAWLIGFSAVAVAIEAAGWKLIAVSAVTLGVALFLIRRRSATGIESHAFDTIGLAEWLDRATQIREPIRVRFVEISGPRRPARLRGNAVTDQWLARRLASRLAWRLGRRGAVTMIAPRRVIWYELAAGGIGDDWVVTFSGGLVRRAGGTDLHADGRVALRDARSRGAFGDDLIRPTGAGPLSLTRLRRRFLTSFPSGAIYAPDRPAPHFFRTLSPDERRGILAAAVGFAREFRDGVRQSRFEVSALCLGGDLQLIFVIERVHNRRARAQWRSFIKGLTLEAAGGAFAERVVEGRVG